MWVTRVPLNAGPSSSCAIVDGTAAVTGTAFFGSLVQHLARALGVRRVYVAECLDADHARARAVWMGSDFAPPSNTTSSIRRA